MLKARSHIRRLLNRVKFLSTRMRCLQTANPLQKEEGGNIVSIH
jgi:hypothetical protein